MRKISPFVVLSAVLLLLGGIYIFAAHRRSSVVTTAPRVVGGLASLPVAHFNLKKGTGQELVQAHCTACHSLAPIIRHEGFAAQTWADEVRKMREQYGCPLDDVTGTSITRYLQQQYAAAESPHSASQPTPLGRVISVAAGHQ